MWVDLGLALAYAFRTLGFFLTVGNFPLGLGGWGNEIKERTGRFGSFFTFHGSGRDGSKAGRLGSFE